MQTTVPFPKPAELLPHRPPMLLIDRVDAYEPGVSVRVSTDIQPDMPFFKGHFPGEPILPGVILIEMMFQACGIFGRMEALNSHPAGAETYRPKSGRAIKIDSASFSQPVLPGDRLVVEARYKHRLMNFSVFEASVTIEGRGAAAKGVVTVLINP